MKKYESHDLSLGKWGPYNKEYFGVCHIANEMLGSTFNFELFPGFFRRSVISTSAMTDGAVKLWGANASLTRFTYRYELEWKDKVFCDAHFNIVDDKAVYVDCEIVNNTDAPQSVNLHLLLHFEYPTSKYGAIFAGYKDIAEASVAHGAILIDAPDYDFISCAQTLAQDGKLLAESEADGACGFGTLISGEYFYDKGHFVNYKLQNSVKTRKIGIRYSAKSDTALVLKCEEKEVRLDLRKAEELTYCVFDIGEISISDFSLCATGEPVDIDAVVLGDGAQGTCFTVHKRSFVPCEREICGNTVTLKYRDSEYYYKLELDRAPKMVRSLYTDDAPKMLERYIHDHVSVVRYDGKKSEAYAENILTEPLFIAPHTKEKMSFSLIAFKADESCALPEKKCDDVYRVNSNADGKKFEFSQNLLAYTTLLNIVYPIYTRRSYIKHRAPGRIWNSLYTWDSGFIGMGLSTVDFESAYENLKAYLTPPSDPHSPYIFHGSVVPVQIFLYSELVSRFPEQREKLSALYPMVMQYYSFFSGMSEDSEQMKSGVLKTWHIFYNSGGWDDYPAQKHVRELQPGYYPEKHNSNITPAITTSVAVLIAKILKNVSGILGINENNSMFDSDIEKYSAAIQKNLWDDEAGYYSYLVHDEDGEATGFLRYSDGTNYNMGLDGAYPYIAGVSNEYQSARILDNIKNGMLTEYGISVVDRRAPYYSESGYWNGSVWMPHQWILVKALLDRGEIDFAVKIAKLALSVWKRECDRTYCCFEHFMSANGRGAGFHQFSGLSTPPLMFFESLYKPGTVSVGFLCGVVKKEFKNGNTELSLELATDYAGGYAIVCMKEGKRYSFTLNGKPIKAKKLTRGAYAVKIEAGKSVITVK